MARAEPPGRAGEQRVAEPAWSVVFAGYFIHHKYDPVPLQLGVVVPQSKQLFDTGQLEVLKVIRVVNEALSVGLVIADAYFSFVIGQHKRMSTCGSCIIF